MRPAVLGDSEKARGWIDMTNGGCGTNKGTRRQAVTRCQRPDSEVVFPGSSQADDGIDAVGARRSCVPSQKQEVRA